MPNPFQDSFPPDPCGSIHHHIPNKGHTSGIMRMMKMKVMVIKMLMMFFHLKMSWQLSGSNLPTIEMSLLAVLLNCTQYSVQCTVHNTVQCPSTPRIDNASVRPSVLFSPSSSQARKQSVQHFNRCSLPLPSQERS